MKMPRLPAALLAMFCVTAPALAADEKAEQIFVRRIASLFAEKCLACHGKDEAKIKGGLDLRTLAATMKGGDSGKLSIVAGKPEASPLYLTVTRAHDDDWKPMPPKEADKLYGEQVAWIKDWIAGGAPWPDLARAQTIAKANEVAWSAEDGVPVKTSGGQSPEWTNRKYKRGGLVGVSAGEEARATQECRPSHRRLHRGENAARSSARQCPAAHTRPRRCLPCAPQLQRVCVCLLIPSSHVPGPAPCTPRRGAHSS